MACTTPKATAPGTATTPPTPIATGTTPSTDTSPGPTTDPSTQTVPTTETTGTHTTGSTSTTPALTDGDGDGWTDVDDCIPDDPLRYPGAPDLCTNRTCGWDFCGGLCGGVA